MTTQKHEHKRQSERAALERAAGKLAAFHRISWREALGRVTSAAFRLHHYRDVRTRMFYDALCNVDRRHDCESDDD